MKILLIDKFHYRFGGAERAYFDTAQTLAEHGHEVAFFAMEHPENEPTPWSRFFVARADYNAEGLSVLQKAHLALKMIWNREAQKKLDALLAEFRPDVVHMHLIYHQLSPSIIWTIKKHSIPMVMTLHDYKHISPDYNMFVDGKVWDAPAWKCVSDRCVRGGFLESVVCTVEHYVHALIGTYKLVDQFIAPSEFLVELSRRKGFAPQIVHVPQPLAPAELAPPAAEQATGDYILYVGRLSLEKGVRVLIDGFVGSHAQKLVIVGTGPDEQALKDYAHNSGRGDVIEFVGYKTGTDLHELIVRAYAIVIPSLWYENMPYAMLEALAAGSIVIATRSGGMVERITDGVNGFLYPPQDTAALTDRINRALKVDRAQMAAAAHASVQDLTRERYYADLMEIYESVGALHVAQS